MLAHDATLTHELFELFENQTTLLYLHNFIKLNGLGSGISHSLHIDAIFRRDWPWSTKEHGIAKGIHFTSKGLMEPLWEGMFESREVNTRLVRQDC